MTVVTHGGDGQILLEMKRGVIIAEIPLEEERILLEIRHIVIIQEIHCAAAQIRLVIKLGVTTVEIRSAEELTLSVIPRTETVPEIP